MRTFLLVERLPGNRKATWEVAAKNAGNVKPLVEQRISRNLGRNFRFRRNVQVVELHFGN